ncbi:ketopantoate reductase family protein [Lysinibacillus yapensis]|uniref:ketopantoate reductase family protein n=1 Tax=Ureibacillus yapensis TaxID=2304605 RepID=UPI001F2D5D29|nr:2-dehydropantoate 2-reductase N-terminal domain-containing protein [Lysinibacillus yapensis]
MKKIETVSLIGLGAVGAAYGSKLHELLKDSFQVVASKDRIQRYENSGISVNGQNYHFHYSTPETRMDPVDLVIFSVKNDDLTQAIQDIQHHIGPDTIILSLLNGISSEDKIKSACESQHILYSVCVEIDAVRQQNETNSVRLAGLNLAKGIVLNQRMCWQYRIYLKEQESPTKFPRTFYIPCGGNSW